MGDIGSIADLAPYFVTFVKWCLLAFLVGCVIFWQIAKRARVRAYGPGGGRK